MHVTQITHYSLLLKSDSLGMSGAVSLICLCHPLTSSKQTKFHLNELGMT